ncbi:2-methylcitrate dehydratase [Roseivivax sp. THAF40]|uniref:MmgE/PrpD family protein n=1 Tax=unclassified Roseivivax TaxID=2639302 RepID=UPI00126892F8|nr:MULTISPECIES: MmgE/PrpD family protein [unclassified Roseivivax]QFS83706.1 2-methylcitrate dehydratase [Roseivivax sp. THAF197b]QFT47508.1 2-methylcitrate dehydratase [Roseivivax sp. THAF40]
MTKKSPSVESQLIEICRRPIPAQVAARARLHLLDWLGCILAARRSEAAERMARAVLTESDDLLTAGLSATRLDAQTAALCLGTLGNVLEMDDLHRASILHPGDTVCAAALATALRRPVTGRALLDALVRGYEIAIRIGTAAAAGGYTPFYNSGTCGVFGAAMAASEVSGLDESALADALGQAGMQAAGIWQCRLEPGFSKQLATAHAARAGVFAAELGGAGFAGPRAILTGKMGFFASYYPGADLAHLTALPAREAWALTEMSVKPFPACRHTHPAISALLSLRPRIDSSAIARIDIHTYRAALDFCDNPEPETPGEARFSLQHTAAISLLRGAPGLADFEGAVLTAPDVAALREKVHLHVDPACDAAFPRDYGASVSVTGAQGAVQVADCPQAWGDPENPMSEAEIVTKFRANIRHGSVPEAAASPLVDALLDLPDAPDLTHLKEALTAALSPAPEYA